MLDRLRRVGYNVPVDHSESIGLFLNLGSYQSGQMGLTVNQLRDRFGGSNPPLPTIHILYSMSGKVGPCGAAVAHSLGKTGVMGSIPITGSRGFWMVQGTSCKMGNYMIQCTSSP